MAVKWISKRFNINKTVRREKICTSNLVDQDFKCRLMSWNWCLLKDSALKEHAGSPGSRPALIFHDLLFYASFLLLFFFFWSDTDILYIMMSQEPNLKAQLPSDVLWLCDRTGAAAWEHQHWSPDLLVSLKSRQASYCPSAALRGLQRAMCQCSERAELCVFLLDLTGLPKSFPGCWLGTPIAVPCWYFLLLQLLSTVASPSPLEEWNIQYRGMDRDESFPSPFHYPFVVIFFPHPFLNRFPQKKVSWL